ncbi:MAG: adenosylcobinamide-GDP ribazoletransferase [Actinomycetota bacterium]|nr:adenosylcobinamide-GDP ribazoletransferase [Actinomycetota bacterium]
MLGAVAFLTALGRPTAPSPEALRWFPVVGAVLGLVLGGVWWVAAELWPPLVAAALVVVVDLALTGLLHLDGLADSADGLLAHGLDASRRLEVMAEPGVGAFAVGVVAVTLVLRVAALAVLAPAPLLLAALWCVSRTVMAVTACALPYARPGGLASSFLGGSTAPIALGGGALALVVAATAGVAAVAAVVVGAVGGAGLVALGLRRVGGFTGDVLGAAGVVAETTGLLVAAARW